MEKRIANIYCPNCLIQMLLLANGWAMVNWIRGRVKENKNVQYE